MSKFWRSLETPFINWKAELSLKWIENCVLTMAAAIGANANAAGADNTTFKITDANLYVSVAFSRWQFKISKIIERMI